METKRQDKIAAFPKAPEQNLEPREPPVNYEAEQALLGAILANNSAFERVADFLLPEHFADPLHGRVFAACAKLIERGQHANAVTLKNYFERDEALSEVGGAAYLAKLQANPLPIINALDYAKTVHDLFLRRQLIAIGEDVVNDAHAHDLEKDASNQIEVAEQRLYDLAETGQSGRDLVEFRTAIGRAIDMAEAARKRDGRLAGVATGFSDLDKLLGGLQNSDLVIVAGRPSMGKTSLATNIAYNVAASRRRQRTADGGEMEEAQPVAFFSLEMSAEQLATRILSEQANVSSAKLRRGEVSDEQFTVVLEATRKLDTLPLYIDDTPAMTVSGLRTRARRLKRKQGLALIVVDYLQLMQGGSNRPENRVQEVSEITRGLKAIAKELDVPLVALSQLSRAPEQRDDKRPQLSDLRESGSIEQDADVVVFLFREEYYLAREEPSRRVGEGDEKFNDRLEQYRQRSEEVRNLAEAIIAKQRHGPIGTVVLHFDGEFTRFADHIGGDHLPDRHE